MRVKHPKKGVESALAAAEKADWTVMTASSGHRWGVMRCGTDSYSECQMSIWTTPRSINLHAGQIRRLIRCYPQEFDW